MKKALKVPFIFSLFNQASNAFPSSQRRGGCAEGADGVVRPANISAELTTPARQPCGCRATPPLRGGECRHTLHHFNKLLLSTFNDSRLRKIAITRANPTAASAAATTSTKKTKIWPLI